MVMIERPSATLPTSVDRPVNNLDDHQHQDQDGAARDGTIGPTSLPPIENAYDHISHLLGDELPPDGSATNGDEFPKDRPAEHDSRNGYPVEEYNDAIAAADQAEECEPAFEKVPPTADWNDSRMENARPWLLAAGAGLLGVVAAVGAIRIIAGRAVETADGSIPSAQGRLESASSASTRNDADVSSLMGQPPAPTDELPNKTDTKVPTNAVDDLVGKDLAVGNLGTERGAGNDKTREGEPANGVGGEDVAGEDDKTNRAPQAVDLFGQILEEAADGSTADDDPTAQSAAADLPTSDDGGTTADDEIVEVATVRPGRHSSVITVVASQAERPQGTDPSKTAEQFRRTIPSIELTAIPFHKFTQFVSDMTSVPITLRWDSILHAGSLVNRKLNVRIVEETSIAEMLDRVLRPLRLAVVASHGQLEIKRRSDGKLRTAKYFISDLLKPTSSPDDLLRLVQQLVEPGTWKEVRGPGTVAHENGKDGDGARSTETERGRLGQIAIASDGRLAIRQAESAHFETVVLLEQMRVARGGKPLSTYPAEIFAPNDRRGLLKEVLTRPIAVRTSGPIELAELFRRIADASGCVLLPDWIALEGLGWHMATDVQVTSDEMTLAEMLEQIELTLGIVYRCLDSRTIEMTSPSAELGRAEFAFYDLQSIRNSGFDTAMIQSRIEQAIGQEQFRAANGVVAKDEQGQHIIVRLPQSLQVLARDFMTAWGG